MGELKDITKVRVNKKLQGDDRIRDYEERAGSIDHFMVGNVKVRCVYSGDGVTLNDQLSELIRTR